MTAIDSPRTSVRPLWETLPQALRDSVTDNLGSPVTAAHTQVTGFSPGLAVRAVLADGRAVFLKGVTTSHPVYGMYAEEAAINRALPAQTPVPSLLATWETDGWLLMAFEDIDGGHPDFAPGSTDLPAVLKTLDLLPKVVDPSPIPNAPTVADVLQGGFHGWQALAESQAELDPWSGRHLHDLAVVEKDWTRYSAGTCLLHVDLRADNMLMRGGEALVIDWAYLHQGAAWIDPAFLAPQLVRAGHSPTQVQTLLAEVTSWGEAPTVGVVSFAVAQVGYWDRSSRLPAPPGVPYLRGYQAKMAAAGRRWIAHLTDWQ